MLNIFFFFFCIGRETLSDICADNEYKIAADFLVLYAYCGLTSYMSLSCSRKGAGVSVPEELQAVLLTSLVLIQASFELFSCVPKYYAANCRNQSYL